MIEKESKNFFFAPNWQPDLDDAPQGAALSSGRKKQETFISLGPVPVKPSWSKITKVFFASFLFTKKKTLPFLPPWSNRTRCV
jgi:hypothetical protein